MNIPAGLMRLAMIGLGKMGDNMVRKLRCCGIEVVRYDRNGATGGAMQALLSISSVAGVVLMMINHALL
ncbi:MAG: NAD(P)-binding domain-containing protein [Gallionella sp.]